MQIAAPSQPEEWWDSRFACEAVFGERPEPSLEGYGPLIRRSLAGMTEALGPKLPQTRAVIERKNAERQKMIRAYYSQRRPQKDSSRPSPFEPAKQCFRGPCYTLSADSKLAAVHSTSASAMRSIARLTSGPAAASLLTNSENASASRPGTVT